jgi:hypothetical protein
LNIFKTIDGTYKFLISQTTLAKRSSEAVEFQWIRNTSLPATPTISSPASTLFLSNSTSLTVAGSCITGNVVWLAGNISQADVVAPVVGSLSQTCALSAYSFTLEKKIDNSYAITLAQTNGINFSNRTSMQWIRDTLAPTLPAPTNPAANPFLSGDTTVPVKGTCETLATVKISRTGTATQSIVCANNIYSFDATANTDGSYLYNITQTDGAGNPSGVSTFRWTRDTSIPATPVITTPASSPSATKTSTFIVAGKCINGNKVTLGGSVSAADVTAPAGSLTQVCASAAFSFTIAKSVDGIYGFNIKQTNLVPTDSAQVSVVWRRDTARPLTPTKIQPSVSPYRSAGTLTIDGGCEDLATVLLEGDKILSQACSGGFYSFSITEAANGTYNYIISQKDSADNRSNTVTQTWIKDFAVPPTPAITVPAINPAISLDPSLTLSGSCVPGYTVTLGGQVDASEVVMPANTLTLTCGSNSSFTFIVTKPVDGSYNLTVIQNNGVINSGTVAQTWVLDTTAPTMTINSAPTNPNFGKQVTFSFISNDAAAAVKCSLDGAGFTACSSPLSFPALANGSHTLSLRGQDAAGNIGLPNNHTWIQEAFNAIALYHFDGDSLTDSGNYSGSEDNLLTNGGTVAGTGLFTTDGRDFLAASANYAEAIDNDSQDQVLSRMTIETFVNFRTLPLDGSTMIFVSKMGAADNLGWEFGVKADAGNISMTFAGSLDGKIAETITSLPITVALGTPIHLTVTWDLGAVRFYCDGAVCGNGTIGTAGTSILYRTTAAMRLGSTSLGGAYLDGILDETRLSQVVRRTGTFTPPASAYSAD